MVFLRHKCALLCRICAAVSLVAIVLFFSSSVNGQAIQVPSKPGKTRIPIPGADPAHGLKSFPQHRLPVYVPGSTPQRRAAWNSLSAQQKQQVMALFQTHLSQAAASLKAKHAAKAAPMHFSEMLHGVSIPFASNGNDLINASIGYSDGNGSHHLMPAAAPQNGDAASAAPTHTLSVVYKDSATSGRLIYAPVPKKRQSSWHRMNAAYSPSVDGAPRLILTSATQWSPQPLCVNPTCPPGKPCPEFRCPVQPPPTLCPDSDGDGMTDCLESSIADAFTPSYHVSANENAGTGFATFQDLVPMTVQTVYGSTPPISYYRVEPSDYIDLQYDSNGNPIYHRYFRVDYLTLWNEDDGLVGSITCPIDVGISLGVALNWFDAFYGADLSTLVNGLGGHPLDNEHSAVLLAAQVNGPSDTTIPSDYTQYYAVRYFAAAHEGTITDRSSTFTPSSPLPVNNHVDMYLSRSKHSTYFANPDGAAILPDDIITATEASIAAYWTLEQWQIEWDYYDECPVDPYYYVVAPDGEVIFVEYFDDGSCYVPDLYWDPVQLAAEEYLADVIFYDCLGEHFTDQGVSFASTRIDVGEPSDPTSGNHFIQDTTADHVGTKLNESIFPDKNL